MMVENALGTPLSEEQMSIQTCITEDDHGGHQQPKDYSTYLYFISGYMSVLIIVFIIFFKTELKRTKADEESRESSTNKTLTTPIVKDTELALLAKEDQGERENGATSNIEV